MEYSPVIIVQGGAGSPCLKPELETGHIDGVKKATVAGYKVLINYGGSALDAVEAAVRVLEDDPVFNAGMTYIGKIATCDLHMN